MLYANYKQQIHSFFFIISLLMGVIFAGDWKDTDAKETYKMETGTGLSSFTGNTSLSGAKRNGKTNCDKDCKIKAIEHAGINPDIAGHLVNECKKQDKEVVNCIKLGASILGAESSGAYNCYKFKCFGIQGVTFTSFEESARDFATRWSKHWYNQKIPSHFYSNSPNWVPKTHFCMSEESSGKNYCINGYTHAWTIFNKLNF